MKQQIIPAGQGREYDWSQDRIHVKTPAAVTAGRVTVVEDLLKPGFHLTRHHHRGMVEIFHVLDGEIHFKFDDELVIATPGMTLNIPAQVWHDVKSDKGGRLLTIFSPGGFDQYLSDLADLSPAQLQDEGFLTALAERYDIWMR